MAAKVQVKACQCHSGTGSDGTMALRGSRRSVELQPDDSEIESLGLASLRRCGGIPIQNLPGDVNDCFYGYMPLTYDNGGNPPGYFGYKVLAVSYGGTLQLFGQKGSSRTRKLASSSGTSWARLTTTLAGTGAENQVHHRSQSGLGDQRQDRHHHYGLRGVTFGNTDD